MIPDRQPDLFRRLKPLYGKKIDLLWLEYQTGDVERKREIEQILTLIAVKRLGMAVGEERVILEPPPAALIGQGNYTVGAVSYPGMAPYPFRLGPQELLRHVFILGPTGTGKSTLILGLLHQFLHEGLPFMVFDFKRNYRCLLPASDHLLVVTVGRDDAPLAVNALQPPPGVEFEEWAQAITDVIGNAYLLLQGAMNVLKEALLRAHRDWGRAATLDDAYRVVRAELQSLRPGSRRYGWLESTERTLNELTKGTYGVSINYPGAHRLSDFLDRAVVFELQGLGDDQKRFFCLYVLQYLLLLRKNEHATREVLRHVLVFDESHNVFPKDQYGEHSVPSRLAREVREYGEAIIAATQQTDVSESLIANSGTKVILRTDFPRDVDFASKLLQVKPEWLSKLPLGTGIARLPTRFYQSFLFTFPEAPGKNAPVLDAVVRDRYDSSGLERPRAVLPVQRTVPASDEERALLTDIAAQPISGISARYERLGWHPMTGNAVKDSIINKKLAVFEEVPTPTSRIKILTLTDEGMAYLEQHGVRIPASRRAGAAHEYWRATIRSVLERDGYAVQEEVHLGDGRRVDVHARKGGSAVTVEVETGKSDISTNIQKCTGLHSTIIFFFVTPELRDQWQGRLPQGFIALTPAELDGLPGLLEGFS